MANRPDRPHRPRWVEWPPESSLRDYVWGALIVACAVSTAFGMYYLFGR